MHQIKRKQNTQVSNILTTIYLNADHIKAKQPFLLFSHRKLLRLNENCLKEFKMKLGVLPVCCSTLTIIYQVLCNCRSRYMQIITLLTSSDKCWTMPQNSPLQKLNCSA